MADRAYGKQEVLDLASKDRKDLKPDQLAVVDRNAENDQDVRNAKFAAEQAAKYNW